MTNAMTAAPGRRPIIVVEDSDEDFEVTVWALRQAGIANPVHRCANACEIAILLADRRGWPQVLRDAYPLLILLDLNVPGMDFDTTLAAFRTGHWWRTVPLVVISTSTQPETVAACYAAGAAGYLQKELDLDALAAKIRSVALYWLRTVVQAPIPDERVKIGTPEFAPAANPDHSPLN